MKVEELRIGIEMLLREFNTANDCLITQIHIDLEAVETTLASKGIFRVNEISIKCK